MLHCLSSPHHTQQQGPKHKHTLVLLVRRQRSRKPFVLFSCQARNPTSPSQQQLPTSCSSHTRTTLPHFAPTPTTPNTDGHPRTCSIRSRVYQGEFERGLQSSGLVWLGRGRSAWVRACRGSGRVVHTQAAAAASSGTSKSATDLLNSLPSFHNSVNHVGPGIDPCGGGSSHVDAGGASDGVHGTTTSSRKGDGGRQQRQQSKTAREQKGRRAAFLPGEDKGGSRNWKVVLSNQYAPALTLRQPLSRLSIQPTATTPATVVIIGVVGQEEQGVGRD